MSAKYSVKLTELVKDVDLKVVFKSTDYEKMEICSEEINRSALQLTGYYDYFEDDRVQVMGKVEMSYLRKMSSQERITAVGTLFAKKIPAVVITSNEEVLPEIMDLAKKYDISVLTSEEVTSTCVSAMIAFLKVALAPRVTLHGVLVEVYGEGILIIGESGIGKSETAIELVKRGHIFVADDAVEIKRVSKKTLVGAAPALIQYFAEIRGIGIVDVRSLFGMGSVKATDKIDLIIRLESWQEGKNYDRMGLNSETTTILGIDIPSITVPVRPGRNLAVIIEVAAMSHRHKMMGQNAAFDLTDRLNEALGAVDEEVEKLK